MYRGCISDTPAIRATNTHKRVNWRSMRMNTTTRARVITERVCRRQSNKTHHFPQSFSSPRFAHCQSSCLFSCDQRVFFFVQSSINVSRILRRRIVCFIVKNLLLVIMSLLVDDLNVQSMSLVIVALLLGSSLRNNWPTQSPLSQQEANNEFWYF